MRDGGAAVPPNEANLLEFAIFGFASINIEAEIIDFGFGTPIQGDSPCRSGTA